MSKQATTVLEFIASGRTGNIATSVEFEGFAVRGDEGNGLRFFKTGTQSTASQTPIQRGDNSFTDANGWVYALNNGSVIYYNGSNNWFPNLGSSGVGTYTSTPTSWNIASVSPSDPNVDWDFEYVANDSLRLRSGYGNASNELDFSRASTHKVIGKTGVLQTNAIDVAALSKFGISCFNESINTIEWSEDFSNAAWVKSGSSIDIYTELDPELNNNASLLKESSSNSTHLIGQTENVTQGKYYNYSIFCKPNSRGVVQLLFSGGNFGTGYANFDLTNKSVSASSSVTADIEILNDGYIRCSISDIATTSGTATVYTLIQDSPSSGRFSAYQGDGVSSVIIFGAQITETKTLMPYSKTEASQSSTSPDLVSFETLNNLPPSSESLTIEIDAKIPNVTGLVNHLIRLDNSNSDNLFVRGEGNGNILVAITGFNNVSFLNNNSLNRYTIVITKETLSIYLNAALVSESSGVFDINFASGKIWLGSSAGAFSLNGYIKAIRIAQSALTSDKITARGGCDS